MSHVDAECENRKPQRIQFIGRRLYNSSSFPFPKGNSPCIINNNNFPPPSKEGAGSSQCQGVGVITPELRAGCVWVCAQPSQSLQSPITCTGPSQGKHFNESSNDSLAMGWYQEGDSVKSLVVFQGLNAIFNHWPTCPWTFPLEPSHINLTREFPSSVPRLPCFFWGMQN